MVALGCQECTMRKLKRCKGPVLLHKGTETIVDQPQAPIEQTASLEQPAPKRRGRKPKAAVMLEMTPPAEPTSPVEAPPNDIPLSNEEQCRQKLRELASIPRKATADEVIATFSREIHDARNAGASWEAISKVLKEYGYNVGDSTLARKMKELLDPTNDR